MKVSHGLFLFRIAGLSALLFLLSGAADPAPSLVLVFADDEAQVTVTDSAGKTQAATEGMVLVPGTSLRTKDTTVELRLAPNGSVVKLARNTVFRIRNLQGLAGSASTDLAVLSGKIRMIAAKLTGVANAYNVTTPMAQAGVRGTDFAVEANADEGDWVCVVEGKVEFALMSDGKKGAAILVGAGEFANAKSTKFVSKKASAADIADKFEGLDFHAVKETDVPGHAKP